MKAQFSLDAALSSFRLQTVRFMFDGMAQSLFRVRPISGVTSGRSRSRVERASNALPIAKFTEI